tara:strand:+ start:21412 stop:21741 length:330 start_codon:yes stop_codon:yes gene_type:complete
MAKFYVESGDIRRVFVAAEAIDAVRRFVQLAISDDKVEYLGDGIIVCERGFYKDFLKGIYDDVMEPGERVERLAFRTILRDCETFSGKEPKQDIMFMTDDILRNIGHIR